LRSLKIKKPCQGIPGRVLKTFGLKP